MNVEEALIESVKKYPVLFDPGEKEYRNKTVRNEAWEEIGNMLGIPGHECKDMWTKMRNAYTNAMKRRKLKSGQGAKHLKWKYEDQMDFLSHTFDHRLTHGNAEKTEEGTSEGEEMFHEDAYLSAQSPASPEGRVSPSPSHPLPASPLEMKMKYRVPAASSKKTSAETSMDEMIHLLNETRHVTMQASLVNEIDLFFLSLSKTAQRLSPEEQVRVKMEVSNVVFQAEFRELQQRSEHRQGNPP